MSSLMLAFRYSRAYPLQRVRQAIVAAILMSY
jgi:hypothetical protein